MAVLAGLSLLASGCSAYQDIHGNLHDPLDVGDAKANVLIFITTDCPIANQYAPEICAIQRAHKDDPLNFYLVHVDPDVTMDVAQKHAKEYGYTGAVIRDPHHRLAQHLGVTVTPEAAIVAAGGKMVYRGRIDNLYGDLGRKRPLGATRHELRNALDAVLAGKEIQVKRTEAIGCYLPK